LVYYLHRLPQQYTGGSLVLWEGNDSVTLEPKHNRAILFPSFVLHEVEKVSVSSERWEDARFSLNYWMGFL
jgi:Rps23 Pro-64 3,4-dihydroxylase Tpa1-like proline 4-hydroxylase